VEYRQLRQFVAVAEELHFGRAAERLGMTQPPLSQAIQRLEMELGVTLFTRTHRSVELTAVGRQILPHAQRVIAEAARLPVLARRYAAGELGVLRLAFVSTADYGIVPELLRQYREQWPNMTIELREATSDVQIEALLAGEIDAGIVIGGARPSMLDYRPLRRESLVVALPEGWGAGIPEESGIELATIAGQPLLLFPRRIAPALHDVVTGCFAERGLTPVFGQVAIQMQTIVSLVSAGLGYALVPESIRQLQRSGARYAPLEGASPIIETGLIWPRRNPPVAVRNLLRMLGNLDQGGDGENVPV